MATKKSAQWEKGQASPNPNGRPKGTGRPISRLRSTLNKLKGFEQEAVDIVGMVLAGEHEGLSKEQIDMAKWLIARLESYTRSAISEESFKADTAPQKEADSLKATGTEGRPQRFSLSFVEEE